MEGLQGQRAEYSDVKGYFAEADLLAHEVMTKAIKSLWPEDDIHSEEEGDGKKSTSHQKGTRTWILDPICGTTNYVRGIPFYSHSLSVLDDAGVLAAGIYHPGMKELFLADRNETTLNGRRVCVSKTRTLPEAIIAFNCNQSDVQSGNNSLAALQKKLSPPLTRRLRIMESANLELAYVACGRLDGYVNLQDKVWDIAAGSLMIASAGGLSSPYQGTVHDLSFCRGIIASNKYLFDFLKAATKSA